MKKRLLGTILAALLLLPVFTVDAETLPRIPVVEQSAATAVLDAATAYLEGIGLPVDFIEKEQVSRGELVQLLVQISRQAEAPSGNYFADVSADTAYAGAVETAYRLKWIDGSGGRLFRPDDAATITEAVKMTIDMLGYRAYANIQGGYPTGYLLIANRCDLLDGMDKDAFRTLTGRDAAVLLSNALTAPMAVQTGVGTSMQYESGSGKTLLSQCYNLERKEGIVTATAYASYSSETHHAKSGCIELDGVPYRFDGDTTDLLGRHVIAYTQYNGGNSSLEFVVPWRNEAVTVWAEKIDRMEDFVLYQLDRTKHKLDRSVSVLYNGKAYPDWKDTDFVLKDGFVTLLDNNHDGDYDIVFLTDITYSELHLVDGLNVVFLGDGGFYLDMSDQDAHFQLYSWDGETLKDESISAFTENSVVGAAISKDGLFGTLWLCTNRIEGTVTEQFPDTERQISIDDISYRTTADLQARYGGMLGCSGTFTLGIDGAIAAAEINGSDANYGYIIDVKRERSLQGNLLVKMLTESGGIVTLTLDESCRIDGERNITKLENRMMPNGVAARQLVKYTLSADGKTVRNIDTELLQTNITTLPADRDDELICYVKGLSSPVKAGSLIFSRFIASAATRMFVVAPLSQEEVTDEDFGVVGSSFFRNDAYYTVDAYDLDANGYPKALVCYAKPTKDITDGSAIAIVDRVTAFDAETVETDRDIQNLKISLIHDGRFQNYYLAEGVSIDKSNGQRMASGDLVRVELNGNVITALSVDFDAATMAFTTEGQNFVFGDNGFNRQISYTLASVAKRMGNQLFYTKSKNGTTYDYALEELRPLLINSAPCVKVNRRTGLVKPMQISEIYDYESAGGNATEMVICQYFWSCRLVVIYE